MNSDRTRNVLIKDDITVKEFLTAAELPQNDEWKYIQTLANTNSRELRTAVSHINLYANLQNKV